LISAPFLYVTLLTYSYGKKKPTTLAERSDYFPPMLFRIEVKAGWNWTCSFLSYGRLVECLPSKCEALSSNPTTTKTKKKIINMVGLLSRNTFVVADLVEAPLEQR
jgi:hypothetical protein